MKMEGGLSDELKRKIAGTRVAIVGREATCLIETAVKRLGFTDVDSTTECADLPECDIAVCIFTAKEDCRKVFRHYKESGMNILCGFNFGIGACVTVVDSFSGIPAFLSDTAPGDVEGGMLDYTEGFSKFWGIPQNAWISEARMWVRTPEVRASIGEYILAAMVTHLLAAILAGNSIRKYPAFYLMTLANDES